jgi:hypothetical protein
MVQRSEGVADVPSLRSPCCGKAAQQRFRRYGSTLLVVVLLAACSTGRGPEVAQTFLEEFEGFPVYHGAPARKYVVLGAVYDSAAAARGTSPMKRSAVAAARARGADAIVVGVVFNDAGAPSAEPATSIPTTAAQKWERAVAIRWE